MAVFTCVNDKDKMTNTKARYGLHLLVLSPSKMAENHGSSFKRVGHETFQKQNGLY